ncbi:unnamed protein product [Pieris brassicae]|uniref:Ionotropic receptor 75a N-terminal domain-containing protein n=1 Tax=Pieris brassicae TaxID=7116 RepID=A0A9P0T487_PIEBR|nr:unnamed protein product [Pieris brassicae]
MLLVFAKTLSIPLLLWIFIGTAAAWDLRFVLDYFRRRDVRHLSLLHCTSPNDELTFGHTFIDNNVRISTCSINKDITKIENVLRRHSVPVGVLLNGACDNTYNVLDKSSKSGLFDASHIWLILDHTSAARNMTIDDMFQQMNLSVDSDIAIATVTGSHYELTDIFNFGKIQGNELERKILGTWDQMNGLKISSKSFKFYDRWDFHNLTFRVVTVVVGQPKTFEPDMLTSLFYTKGISVFTKTAAIVLDVLKEKHNFRFNYTVAGRWIGPPDKNASLAVTNSLYWGQQDLSCTSARITSERLQWVDIFNPPVTQIESRFFYLIPNKGIGNYENRFLTPLSPAVWWCSVGAGIFCVAVLAVAAVLERRPRPAIYAMLSVLGAVCQQGYEEGTGIVEHRYSCQGQRVTLLVIGLTSMLLYNYYTSSVVSWLLSAAPPTLSDIDGLIRSDFELIFENIGYTTGWFEDAGFFYYKGYKDPKEDELREKVRNTKRTKDLYQTVEYGIELIRTGDYAYHTEPYSAYQTISRTFVDSELCRLGSLPMIYPSPVYIMTQKKSSYKEFFNWSLMRLNERGHIKAAQARVAGFIATCSGSTPRALALGQAAPAFGLLASITIVAVVIMFLEILWHRWAYKNRKGLSFPKTRNE